MGEVATSTHPHLDKLLAAAVKLGAARTAVAYPCSASALKAALTASELGLIEPLLVGPVNRIRELAEAEGLDLGAAELIETGTDPIDAAAGAIGLIRSGRATLLMKGSLHTDELMGAAVAKDGGLRTGRRTSHAFLFDVPGHNRPFLMADCVVNIAPGLIEKRDITQNAIELAHALGLERPYVGILSAVETVNPQIPGTIEAAALSKMAERGQITGAIVDGPLAFDVAISGEAARIKGLTSPVSERPDILIVPNLEAGNLLYKQLVYLAKAECAGIILGAAVPIILTSRADSATTRIASTALAVIKANDSQKRLTLLECDRDLHGHQRQ